MAEPCEVMCPCLSSTSSLLSAIFLGTQLNLKRLVKLLLVVRGECPASPNPAPVASPMKRSAPRLAGPFTTPLQRSSIPLSRLLASSISSMMTMISLLQLNAPYQRARAHWLHTHPSPSKYLRPTNSPPPTRASSSRILSTV